MLYFIGLGLGDEKDITVRGLEIVKGCKHVYLENYTAILSTKTKIEKLEKFYEQKLIIADREMVEQNAHDILDEAKDADVAFLVVGDPFCATTHTDLFIRADELDIKVQVIHNASIMNAVAACGLQLYNFGKTISIPYWTEMWKPASFYKKIIDNQKSGKMHTMCLLDIRVKEQSELNLAKGLKIYEPPRFMTVGEALDQLTSIEEKEKSGIVTDDTIVIGLARVGQPTQLIVSGTVKQIKKVDFGEPLHTLVIPGETHFIENDMIKFYSYENYLKRLEKSKKKDEQKKEDKKD